MNDVLTLHRPGVGIEDVPRASPEVVRLVRGPRVIGELRGPQEGPTLLVSGSLHGNEPAGALALDRIFGRLETAGLTEVRGRMVGLLGNRQALGRGRRFLQHDLNRFWSTERVARLRERTGLLEAEAEELRELDLEVERLLREGEGRPVFLLDLHTTSGQGPAFANLDDTLVNRRFALQFPVPLVVGLEEELAGTFTGYLSERGAVTLGFEAGQHDDPTSVDRAEAAVWIALEASGVLPRGSRPEAEEARRILAGNRGELPHVVEIRHRQAIRPGDGFVMRPGYRNFQEVDADELLAQDARSEIRAGFSSRILMPLYQELGEDGFFLVRPVWEFWLDLSAWLRRRRIERYLHLLPGVRAVPREPGEPERFTVDRRYARWLALELFHLLGFRRRRELGRYLMMIRRPYDEPSR